MPAPHDRLSPKLAAEQVLRTTFPEAQVGLLAGSVVRGDGTSTSDLDLVVCFDRVPAAWRHSLICDGWPVEAFCHDPETLRYFLWKVDRPDGVPVLARMVAEGIAVPESCRLATRFRDIAQALLDAGPPKLTPEKREDRRYAVTDLLEDLRDPRDRSEMIAIGVRLYESLADLVLRSRDLWSAKGKWIPRALQQQAPDLHVAFEAAFERLFERGETGDACHLATAVLMDVGGPVFEGYRRTAPPGWRLADG